MATVHVNDAEFDAEVRQAETAVIVDFWAEWCGPCRMLTPTIEQLADDYQGRAKVGKLDVDANRAVAQQFGVMSIPTIVVLKGGEVTKKFVGISQKEELAAALDEAM